MFRELVRKNRRITESECIEILKNEKRGVLSVIGDYGYPYGMPMNHYYNEDDGKIYFHCGKGGHRADSLEKCKKVSFCVYDKGYKNQGEWALNIKSVIVFGEIEIVDDVTEFKEVIENLCKKFTDDEEYIKREIRLFAEKTTILKMTPQHICGKNVNEA